MCSYGMPAETALTVDLDSLGDAVDAPHVSLMTLASSNGKAPKHRVGYGWDIDRHGDDPGIVRLDESMVSKALQRLG